jgi:hypothetical protein
MFGVANARRNEAKTMMHSFFGARRQNAGVYFGVAILCFLHGSRSVWGQEADNFFESEIRPVLVEQCLECHGAQEQANSLRLDSRAGLLRGGDTSPSIIPGDAAKSLLVKAIRHQGDLQMPPTKQLSEHQIAAIEHWIDLGAPWPDSSMLPAADARRSHWSFQPLEPCVPPDLPDQSWCQNSVDAFILSKLGEEGLAPSNAADRRTLIRRISYTLTGLPPTFEDVQEFEFDRRPDATAVLVDRLLASPAYGEHWARHWLDIARYSDTKGYVYAREERFWTHAWSYRDWVVDALNSNMPYDRFLLLQLAADQVADGRKRDLAAMGYLTLGRRFLGVNRDIIDDRIDVVCRGMLGLTVSCARCHDHKYDPIPTADYYALYGVFDSCAEQAVALDEEHWDDEFRAEFEKRQQELKSTLSQFRNESATRCRERIADYLRAQRELHKYPASGFDQVFAKTDLLPDFVRRWEAYLYEAERRRDPVFVAWHAFANIAEADWSEQAHIVTRELAQLPSDELNPRIAHRFTVAPASFEEVIARYAQAFAEIDTQWIELVKDRDGLKAEAPTKLDDSAAEQLRQVLYDPDGPCVVPDGSIVHSESYFDLNSCTELWKRQGEVDRFVINSERDTPFALTLIDRPTPKTPRIFRRGDPLKQGDAVPRQFLSALSTNDSEPSATREFKIGSGRLELAQAIIDPQNPLTARVIVNRVWGYHFGHGLVETSSDFGLRSEKPAHLQLLDSLAAEFIQDGWDLKKLHRKLLLSACFAQASNRAEGRAFDAARELDPNNQLLWRMNPRRLAFEEFNDSLMMASNAIDREMAGKPVQLFDQPFPSKRTLYALVDRQYLPATLRVFDFANPDLHVSQRAETTVPQQALFLMNHPLVLQRAAELSKMVRQEPTTAEQAIKAMFQLALQRWPTEPELADALQLVQEQETPESLPAIPETQRDWQYGFAQLDETNQCTVGFTALPHFNGSAWQGGPQYPDGALGWLQLTATGGHPGNDREHAVVRRWTAPADMTVDLRSELIHDAAPGDGVRAFVVSSRGGVLANAVLHQGKATLNAEDLECRAGETIDFLVDIGDVLNSDQHLWKQTIRTVNPENGNETQWDSTTDFTMQQSKLLDPWEQLAQVILCTNEFTFLD